MKTILICDDHQLFANAIATCLKELNYIVQVVNNKTSCLQILKSERFHVFICDLNLNSGDGFELLNETKKNLRIPRLLF
jgi:CheY-like chemotaxis protein